VSVAEHTYTWRTARLQTRQFNSKIYIYGEIVAICVICNTGDRV
jgi:hypothetical protein